MSIVFEGAECGDGDYEKFHFHLNRILEANEIEPVKINSNGHE